MPTTLTTLRSTFPPAPHKVTLENTRPNNNATKQQVENILFNSLQVSITSITKIPKGFLIRTDITEHVDKIIAGKSHFANLHLTPRLPKSILATQTLVIRYVDDSVTDHTEEDILHEITNHREQQQPQNRPNS